MYQRIKNKMDVEIIKEALESEKTDRAVMERIDEIEVIGRIYYILASKKLGKNGFVVLCIPKIYDNFVGLEEAADMYPYQIYWYERMDEIAVITRNKTKSWYISYGRVKGQNTKVAVIYQTKAYE